MPPCNFCQKDSAPYTCPRCSAAYCSLKCYKCQEHAQCSESFYKEWVREESKARSGDPAQKQSVVDILRRLANSDQSDLGDFDAEEFDEDGAASSEEGDAVDLHERLEGLDLDRDTDEIWARLTAEERSEFERIVASREILNLLPQWKPWWKIYTKSPVLSSEDDSLAKLSVFQKLVIKNTSAPLQHDICSVLFAYCFLCRFFNGEYEKNCDAFLDYIVTITSCFDGSDHRPAADAPTAAMQVFQQAVSGNEEFASLLDVTFVCKIIRDVAAILKAPRKEAVCKAFVDLLHIFDLGLPVLKSSKKVASTNADAKRPNRKKIALLAKKKVEYFSGWIVCASEDVFQHCGESLHSFAIALKADSMQFDLLKRDVEHSGVADLQRAKSDAPKIVEL